MGKIPPPPEVFDSWTPEAQAGYDMPLNNMAMQRENLYSEANQLEASAAGHDRNAKMFQQTIDQDAGKYGPDAAKFDGTVVLVYKEEHEAEKDRAAAAAKRAEADELDKTINELSVPMGDLNQTPADLPERQQAYADQLRKQLEEDQAKLAEMNAELQKLKQELDDRWFKTSDLEEAIDKVQSEMMSLVGDMNFNLGCLQNTNPPLPPKVPTPTPVGCTFVATGAKMMCPFAMGGMAPFTATPGRKTFVEGPPMGNIMDFKPIVNIPSFGVCSSLANPTVAAATAAAFGALTPMPCVPNIVAPWKPGKPNVLVENFPAMLNTDTLQCLWGGVITIMPG